MTRAWLVLLLSVGVPSVLSRPIGIAMAVQEERAGFHAVVDPVIDALWAGLDQQAGLGHVQFISQFWRLPGNHGYDASIDRIRDRLTSAGFVAGGETTGRPPVWVDDDPHAWPSW